MLPEQVSLIDHFELQAGGATSSGPAAGSGLEIILQGFNWESCKGEYYKVSCYAADTQH